jgi:hypothetical protein
MATFSPQSYAHMSNSDIAIVYTSIWQNIDREDRLVGQRLTALVVVAGGVFAAYAFAISALAALRSEENIVTAVFQFGICSFVFLLSALSLWFTFATRSGIDAAFEQIDTFIEAYQKHKAAFDYLLLPQPYGRRQLHNRGRRAATVFPTALGVVWAVALLVSFAGGVNSVGSAVSTVAKWEKNVKIEQLQPSDRLVPDQTEPNRKNKTKFKKGEHG